jgi:hypothetical protein
VIILERKEIEEKIKKLEKKREKLVRKGAWMAIYVLEASLDVLKDKLK